MAATYDSLLLRNQAEAERRLVEDHLRLARETAVRMLYHAQSDGTVPNTRQVKQAIERDVWEQVLKPYYIGDGNHPLAGVDPQSPYARVVVNGIRRATRVQVERQAALVRSAIRDPEVVAWLTGPRPATLALPGTPRPDPGGTTEPFAGLRDGEGRIDFARARADLVRPRGEYDPFHRWVDPNGHVLSDRVWNTAEDVRERINRLMDYHIGRGTGAVEIARELERFLTPGAAGMKTKKPYGTEGSYAARRLARTEITVAAHRATVAAAAANPMVRGVQWKLSPSHPEYDICDEYARGGPNRDGIYPVDDVPGVPHPHCLCVQVPVPTHSREELVRRLRGEIRRAQGDLFAAVGPEAARRLQGILNPEFMTEAIMNGTLKQSMQGALDWSLPWPSEGPAPVERPRPRRTTLRPGVNAGPTSPELVGDVVTFAKGDTPLPGAILNGIPFDSSGQADWATLPDNIDFDEPPIDSQGFKVSAGIIMVEDDGRIWIVEPTNHFGGYQNTFPKGGKEPGLTLQQTARKETWEETGLRAEITGFLTDAKGSTSITRYYIGKRVGGDPLTMGWESQAVKLVTLDEAKQLLNVKRDKETLAKLQALMQQPGTLAAGLQATAAARVAATDPGPVAVPPGLPTPEPASAPGELPFFAGTPKLQQKRLLEVEAAMRAGGQSHVYAIGRRGGVIYQEDGAGYLYGDLAGVRDKLRGATVTFTIYGDQQASLPMNSPTVLRALDDGLAELRTTGSGYTYAMRFDKRVWGDPYFRDKVAVALNSIRTRVQEEAARDPALMSLPPEEATVVINHRIMSRLALGFESIEYARFANPPVGTELEPSSPTPTPAARAPVVEPVIPARPGFLAGGFPDDLGRLVETRKLGGSTGAVQVRDPLDGRLYVMKRGANADHLRAEAAADKAYRLLGVNVPSLHLYETKGGPVKLAEWVEGQLLSELRVKAPERFDAARRELQKDFAVDAVFMAWDVIGTGYDNILVDEAGKVWRIDNGGSFIYRAQGAIKAQATQNKWVDELWTMRDRNVNPYAAEIFDGMDYGIIGRRLAEIGARQKEILAVLPAPLRPLMAERLGMAADYGQIAVPFLDDRWKSGHVEDFTRLSIDIRRNTDLLEKLPTTMASRKGTRGRNRVYLYDDKGKPWDDLRDTDSQSGLVSKIARYMSSNGMNHAIIQEYATEQAGDSWKPLAQAFKYHVVQDREKDIQTTYWWKSGLDTARQHYEDAIARYGEETYRRTWAFWRVINYEFLRNVDFKHNDRKKGLVTLARTEQKGVMDMYGLTPGKTGRMPRGSAESTSIYDSVFVHGTETTRQQVPHHRIFGNYFFDRGPGRNVAMFLGDGENEFVAMLDDLDVEYLGYRKNI